MKSHSSVLNSKATGAKPPDYCAALTFMRGFGYFLFKRFKLNRRGKQNADKTQIDRGKSEYPSTGIENGYPVSARHWFRRTGDHSGYTRETRQHPLMVCEQSAERQLELERASDTFQNHRYLWHN
jgi:hypothetical protein